MIETFRIVYSVTQYTDINKALFTLQHYGFRGVCLEVTSYTRVGNVRLSLNRFSYNSRLLDTLS